MPETDGSDLFLRLAPTRRQSFTLKTSTTCYKTIRLRLMITLYFGLSAFILTSEMWIHFVLREQSRGVCVCLYDVIKVHWYSDEYC